MPANATEILPPLLPISPEDHGGWVITVSAILLIVAALATTVTLISRVRILHSLTWSDIFLIAAMIVFIPQTTCANIASSNGIGKHRKTLSDAMFESYSNFLYASQILSVVVLACSKASVALLLISIKPFSVVLLACKMLLGLIGAWTIAFTIALAVECAQPQVWDLNLGRHMNQEALYTGLAMSQWKCFQICALFGLRVLVPVLTIPYIMSLRPVFHSTPLDQSWHILMPTIWLQLIQSASILCTCIPSLKRALAELQTGMMAGTVSEFFELSVSGAHSTIEGSTSKSGRQSANATGHSGLNSGNLKGLRHGNHNRMIEPSESMQDLRESATVQTSEYDMRWELEKNPETTGPGNLAPLIPPTDPNLVTWDGPDDPQNPKNWPARRKWMVFVPMSLYNLLSSMSSATVAPALSAIHEDLGFPSTTLLILSLSVFFLGSAIVPLFTAPISEMIGRVSVLLTMNVIYIVFNTACGAAKSPTQLIIFRFLSGLGAAGPYGIGSGMNSDLFDAHERGKAIAVFTLAPLVGTAIGPITGGFVV
ncbi:hypothetical protein ANOM_000758 [Aspergillus nomiae NRRL 13137]|uniref:Major facilitator superfamily (MFS) profile domain-containing protein n=1 Tax=Aspergillus nomiae NRRL (strain ATCC 15546 / NRRL 13137 / CBS 260.88 / M93) TaxID=1509407 RepID=A0A0L1JGY8_ASPN3|nr:uncharacterized protein ANOM_000758 [Aspergillus nomiae NRRL 13137]KNG91035.1 hypothetical protein ANOM_000758 [Aspergillus nomiae NRRL 13137]